MSFSAVLDSNGKPLAQGCLEQITLLLSCWVGTPSDTGNLLTIVGGGTVLVRSFDLSSIPPVWIMVSQPGHYYLSFGGSATTLHWAMNVTGAVPIVPVVSGPLVHGFFKRAWDTLRPLVLAQLPLPPGIGTITITGHSYGGALAQLAGNDLAGIYGSAQVDVITFGQPKAMTVGYTGVSPGRHVRVINKGDIVPYLPPAIPLGPILANPLGPILASGLSYTWRHYGTGWIMAEDGTFTLDPAEYVDGWIDPARLATSGTTTHYLNNYVGRLATAVVNAG